jgi:hypothetical protein
LTASEAFERLDRVPRLHAALALVACLGAPSAALGQCPPACAGGGGPAATDCFLAYDAAPAHVIACTDGDPACDGDGTIDGACTFGLAACTTVAVGACAPTPLDRPPSVVARGGGGEQFASAVRTLPTGAAACTDPGLVRLAIVPSAKRLKPAKLVLRMTAVAGGRKDRDRFKLVCAPARPSLAAHVQPIFTARCTYAGCHAGTLPSQELSLEAGESAAGLAERALAAPRIPRVKPGRLGRSYLARSVLGFDARLMPDGCPDVVDPVERCLTAAETYVVLAWIQGGALP